MSELKFKQTKSDNFSGKEVAEGDLIAYNTSWVRLIEANTLLALRRLRNSV